MARIIFVDKNHVVMFQYDSYRVGQDQKTIKTVIENELVTFDLVKDETYVQQVPGDQSQVVNPTCWSTPSEQYFAYEREF